MQLLTNSTYFNSNRYWYFAILIATLCFFYLEIISQSYVGILVSLLVFIVVAFLLFKSTSIGILVLIIIMFLIPEFPRDILLTYGDISSGSKEYNVLSSVKLGFGTLLLNLIILSSLICLFKNGSISTKFIFTILITFIWILFVTIQNNIMNNEYLNASLFITNIKFFIVIFSGMIAGYYLLLKHKDNAVNYLFSALYLILIIISFRAIFYVFYDFLVAKSLSFDIQTKPLLAIPIMLFFINYRNLILEGKNRIQIASLFSVSRGEMILIIILFSLNAMLSKAFFKKVFFKFLLFMPLVLFVVYIFNSSLFEFFFWKISELSILGGNNVSGSALVRGIEIDNILCMHDKNVFNLLFGNGLMATYNFNCIPLPGELIIDLKSYSQDQLNSNIYYTVHTFLGATLLKFGLFGLFIYLALPLIIAYKVIKSFSLNNEQNLAILSLMLIVVYFLHSRIEFQFLTGILASFAFFNNRSKQN